MKRQLLRFTPDEGMKVLIRARITLYEARGDFQLVVDHMEPAGEGQLRQAIEQLKNRLDQEGLFEAKHKKDIPVIPARVGVVTSATGAAIRDVLNVFERRFPAIQINIYPVAVQGDNAAAEINAMLKLVDERNENDLLILTRGGGSLEDLMAFNDEQLARTIFEMNTPVISAVGHEIDTSISDLVADRRAPTPSAAAELASPDQQHIRNTIDKLFQRMQSHQRTRSRQHQAEFIQISQRLQALSPARQLQTKSQTVDLLEQRLLQSIERKNSQATLLLQKARSLLMQHSPENHLQQLKTRFHGIARRLQQISPQKQIHQQQQKLSLMEHNIIRLIQQGLKQRDKQVISFARLLDSVSPLATLGRGYAIVRDKTGTLVKKTSDVSTGDQIETQFSDGSIHSRVE
jgi:exodeoxyribonuclease VII large subunit